MVKNYRKLFGIFLFFWAVNAVIFLPSLHSQDIFSEVFPHELEEDLSAGATAIYHLNFKIAENRLNRAIKIRPDHPAAYFFVTMSKWYELIYDSMENRNSRLEKSIQDSADDTIRIAKKFSKSPNSKNQSVGFLYWGGSLGAKGWYYVTRGQWVKAYLSGKKGYEFAVKAIEMDPELYDGYLGLGMYQYYAATLGTVLKVLASFFVHGDKEKALQYLHLAESKSRYVKLEASYFLWNAALEEDRFEEASEKVKLLLSAFPDSPLFRWCEIQTLFYQKNWTEVLKKSEQFIYEAHKAPQPENFQSSFRLLLSKVYYHAGLSALHLKKIHLARTYFDQAINQPSEFKGWKVMAYLRRGEIFDLEKNRTHAWVDYSAVLRLPEFWKSRKVAKRRMKEGFRADQLLEDQIVYSPLQFWNLDMEQ